MPRTRGRQTQRVSPTDTGNMSMPSSLMIGLTAFTAAVLRTRLRERNLPTSGNKAALIERLEQSTSADDPGTQCEQPTDSVTPWSHQADPPAPPQQTHPLGSVTQHHTDTTSDSNPRAATTSMNIPTNLLTQLQTYLQHATETQQVSETQQTNTPGISHIAEDQLSDASDLPRTCLQLLQMYHRHHHSAPNSGLTLHIQEFLLIILCLQKVQQTTHLYHLYHNIFWTSSGKVSMLILVHLPVMQCMAHQSHRPHLPLK